MTTKGGAAQGHPIVKVCPECGIELSGVDIPKHVLGHWPAYLPQVAYSRLAQARKDQLIGGGVAAPDYRKDEEGLG